VLAYSAAVFALLQVVEPVFEALLLPDLALRVLVLLILAGFPFVVVAAWVYELTADGIRRTPPGPEVVERRRVPLRRWLQLVSVGVMASVLVAATAAGIGRIRYPAAAPDGRAGLAVFPLRATQALAEPWSEGAADLLATALDGTVGLRIVDPWSLWRPLRASAAGPAAPPEPAVAAELAAQHGAHRFLLGSVVPSPGRVDLTVRLYQVGRVDPIATFGVAGPDTAMAEIVRDAAVGVLSRVFGLRRPADLPVELDFGATRSPEALKAYLAARDAMRRGLLDSANVSIDRALQLDSTFVLAAVAAVTIKSWGFSTRGQPYTGFFELLDRVSVYADSVDPRTRLRLEAMDASVRTEGARAHAAAMRILEIDSSDFDARLHLAVFERAYGWQFGAPYLRGRNLAEDALRLDSTNVVALTTRAWWAVALRDEADQRLQLERIEQADTTGTLGHAWLCALRASLATDAEFQALLPTLAALPPTERVPVIQVLRAANVARVRSLLEAMSRTGEPFAVRQADGEQARLDVARGHAARVDSAILAGGFREGAAFRRLQFLIVAASLVGIGDEPVTHRVVAELSAFLPPDSALAYLETRPVWWGGWLVGAYHAAFGDTAVAHRWSDALGTLPPGGSPREYPRALQADIAARLAVRRGDLETALDQARLATELWSIHADNALEAMPAPIMRFHLGQLYREANQDDRAKAMFTSLIPPTTWAGFLTARAAFELGNLELEQGDTTMAAFHFHRALQLWEGAGPGATAWLEETRSRLGHQLRDR
jgi:hypothetical protein